MAILLKLKVLILLRYCNENIIQSSKDYYISRYLGVDSDLSFISLGMITVQRMAWPTLKIQRKACNKILQHIYSTTTYIFSHWSTIMLQMLHGWIHILKRPISPAYSKSYTDGSIWTHSGNIFMRIIIYYIHSCLVSKREIIN